jgi:hypothetical protein
MLAGMMGSAAPASAATASQVPTAGTWGVWKSCGTTYPSQNCGEVRATAEDPTTRTLFAVGDFTNAIDPTGTTSLPYQNLVPIDESTGGVVPNFAAHTFNGRIYAVAVDPSSHTVYVGGDFTKVDGSGLHDQHAAAFDETTGALRTGFNVKANDSVRALLLANNVLYLGGRFSTVQSAPRTLLAAVDPATGTVSSTFLPPTITWTTTTNRPDVRTLALGADATGAAALYVGGHFDTVAGSPHQSVIRVNPGTGTLDPAFAPKLDVTSGDGLQAVDSIAWLNGSQDGTPGIVVAQAAHTNRAYRFTTTGSLKWKLTPDGDMQSAAVSGTSVYLGGHFTCVATAPASCYPSGAIKRVHIVAVNVTTGAIDPAWAPSMNPTTQPYYFGVWSVEITADGALWAGGAFKSVAVGTTTYAHPKLAAFPAI